MEGLFSGGIWSGDFCWESLGDIKKGRANLGEEMPVIVYRLMQYTMMDILSKAHGKENAEDYFRRAGFLAGKEFAKNMLDIELVFDDFAAQLQVKLRELKIGIIRIEEYAPSTGDITLTVEEDLDCSGLPASDQLVCCYDEGFLAGILEVYTGREYNVREIDCWASGSRICRFRCIAR